MQLRDDGAYIVDPARLEVLVGAMLQAVGVPEEDAGIVARALVGADVRGMNSHGILRLPVYIRRLQQGGYQPHGTGVAIAETAGTLLLDGQNGLGIPLTLRAMKRAIAKARGNGIAAVGVRGSNHNGEGAFHVLPAIAAGMIGIATTNGSPIMPPFGGTTKFSGPLPITVGVPAGEERPILLDAALGMSSRGKILYHAEKGLPVPDGWLVDKDGNPTNDASWISRGGWILPIGAHKGAGLIIVCEILAGLLTGALFGSELKNLYDDLDQPQGNGHLVIAIDIAAFVDLAGFKERMDAFIRIQKETPLAPGFEEILMPGEIEFRKEEKHRREGVPIERKVVDEVLAVAQGLGLAPEL
jgi:LDH2 family malate/lactate/ureidoglycolate dehydrogenase